MNKANMTSGSVNLLKRLFTWLNLVILAFSPHIFLDYFYTDPDGVNYYFVNGQFYFYFLTILSGVFLIRNETKSYFIEIFSDYYIAIAIGLFCLGFCFSEIKFHNLRLILILCSLTLCMIVAASVITNFSRKDQYSAVILFATPFAFPVFLAFALHFFGPLDLGVVFENSTHSIPERWHLFNYSANGFGLDAAIVCITSYFLLRQQTPKIIFLIMVLIFTSSVWVLIQSGTRAAYVFFLSAAIMYELLHIKKRYLIIRIMSALVFIVVFIFTYGVNNFLSRMRLEGDWSSISSSRTDGIKGLWEIFIKSPFRGSGFGAADYGLAVEPTNLFYFGLLAEVGVFGAIGAILLMLYPLVILTLKRIKGMDQFSLDNNKFSIWATCILAGFVPYLMFEFNVYRVSATNQIYFLCLFSSIGFIKKQSVKKS